MEPYFSQSLDNAVVSAWEEANDVKARLIFWTESPTNQDKVHLYIRHEFRFGGDKKTPIEIHIVEVKREHSASFIKQHHAETVEIFKEMLVEYTEGCRPFVKRLLDLGSEIIA